MKKAAYRLQFAFQLILIVSFLSSCAAIYTQSSDPYENDLAGCPEEGSIPNVYSGSVFDLSCVSGENVGFFCLVDLPFSFVVDTVMLPYTLYKQSQQGDWYDLKDCRKRNPAKPQSQ